MYMHMYTYMYVIYIYVYIYRYVFFFLFTTKEYFIFNNNLSTPYFSHSIVVGFCPLYNIQQPRFE